MPALTLCHTGILTSQSLMSITRLSLDCRSCTLAWQSVIVCCQQNPVFAAARGNTAHALHNLGILGSQRTAREQHQNSQIYPAHLSASQSLSAVHSCGKHVLPIHSLSAAHSRPVPNLMGDNCWPAMLCSVHQCDEGTSAAQLAQAVMYLSCCVARQDVLSCLITAISSCTDKAYVHVQ